MKLMLYIHTIIIRGSSITAQNKPLTYLSRECTTMTQSVVRPSNLGALWAGNLSETLLIGTAFFVLYSKIFLAKDVSTARNGWRKESFCAETILLVSSYTAIE